jgi:subtilisin family serine protease
VRRFADVAKAPAGAKGSAGSPDPRTWKQELKAVRAKLQPKLQMFANSDTRVTSIRAEHSASLVLEKKVREDIPQVRGPEAVPIRRRDLPKRVRRGRLDEIPQAKAHVYVELLRDAPTDEPIKGESSRKGNIVAATVPFEELPELANRPDVLRIELGEPLAAPCPVISTASHRAPRPRRIGSARSHHGGEGTLIGIIDVGGFDFAHPDFLVNEGTPQVETRFVRIWDQGGNARPAPGKQGTGQWAYGAEFRKEHLDRAIRSAARFGLPSQDLERQSQMVPGSHGTHVASIAAGNTGVCPRSFIAGVLVSLSADEEDRRRTFSDSIRIVQGIEYLLQVAEELKDKHSLDRVPVSINISLGTNGYAHDASSAVDRWIDAALSVPGRSVCVAAGNAGQHMPEFEGDTGWIMGRIHTSGRIGARELYSDVEWNVVGNGIADLSENELELWYSPQDRFGVSVRPPGGPWIGPVEPGEFIENQQLSDGSFLSVYSELYHPSNGANSIAVYLSPLLSTDGIVGVIGGQWVVRLHGREVRDGRYHGWIERDDPRPLGLVGAKEAWSFPSFFSERSYVDEVTVSSLACGNRIVSVANLDEAAERINASSSQGPTRDNRFKPDVAAPGTEVVAAKGFSEDQEKWVAMTGTSMASPYVAGVVGLMLATQPDLTAAQIGGVIQRTALPLPAAGGFSWVNDAGFGVIQPDRCLEEAAILGQRRDLTP